MATKNKELQTDVVEKEEVEVVEGAERTRPVKAYVPRADIYETDDSLVIVADMPGVDENNVDITLEKNVLSLKGYLDFQTPENYSLAYAEYEVGDYERSFTLSDEIDRDKIEATISDGVLRVFLAKAGPAKTKKISVKSA
ncbi:MAG: Hsp20/alpha crystallin family protein [Chloroflexi bacterium]|nr:MAG: Hsp20/alpha crystallin family protein [Chloroflexota bacterium]